MGGGLSVMLHPSVMAFLAFDFISPCVLFLVWSAKAGFIEAGRALNPFHVVVRRK
jgi:hypothetical protein